MKYGNSFVRFKSFENFENSVKVCAFETFKELLDGLQFNMRKILQYYFIDKASGGGKRPEIAPSFVYVYNTFGERSRGRSVVRVCLAMTWLAG